MGLDAVLSNMFDSFVEEQLGGAMKAYEENQKYPSVTSLTFTTVPEEKAEELSKIKVGLFGGGTKKEFIKAITDGRTTFAEVLAVARMHRITDRSENTHTVYRKYFYKMADLNGNILREDAPMIDDKFALTFECDNGDCVTDTGCADVVDPGNYPRMILLHYYLKDNQYYVLLTKEQFDDMSDLVKNAGYRHHFVEDGIGYKW